MKVTACIIPKFTDLQKLPRAKCVEMYRKSDEAGRVSFITRGKLYATLGDEARKLLLDAGISKGSVSNAAYGSKTFGLISRGLKIHLGGAKPVAFDEAAYDKLTFSSCVILARATSDTAKGKIFQPTEAQFSAMLTAKNWEDELEAFLEDGKTQKERDAEKEAQSLLPLTAPASSSPPAQQTLPLSAAVLATSATPVASASTSPQPQQSAGGKIIAFPAKTSVPAVSAATASSPAPSPYKKPTVEEDTLESVMELIDTLEAKVNRLQDEEAVRSVIGRIEELAGQWTARVAA